MLSRMCCGAGVCGTGMGHHSRAMYEPAENAITVVGKVTELLWANPHVYIYIDVVNEDGQAESWALEGGSPYQLTEQGLPRGNLQPGDEITILVRRLRSGGRGGLFREVTFADGSNFVYRSATPSRQSHAALWAIPHVYFYIDAGAPLVASIRESQTAVKATC